MDKAQAEVRRIIQDFFSSDGKGRNRKYKRENIKTPLLAF